MKPEKVKSRWRRNSEMESFERSSMSPTTLETYEENTSIENNESLDEEITGNVVANHKNFPVYESLDENIYLFEIKRTKRKKEVRRMVCDCSLPKEPNELPCGDECLNRLLMIECGSRCVNGHSCTNKRFQKRLYAKTEPFMTARKGYGLKLLENVSKGSFIIEYVGEVINLKEFRSRVKQYARRKSTNHFYFMALKSDEIIDATNKANLSRFINHSCDPNLVSEKWTVNGFLRVGFFAKKCIKAGEELTFDYQFERYGREAQKCYCESDNCNGYIGGDITVDIYNSDSKCTNKRKKIEERRVLEDLMLEKEIEKLCLRGLRNKEETLILARLMVRAEDSNSREKLLDIIMGTSEVACLRLFLDYHGLSLIWSWMPYLNERDVNLKTKILKALFLLPVPNRTILLDSKVLNVVEKWASVLHPDSENVLSDPAKRKCDTSDSETDGLYSMDNSFNVTGYKKSSNDESDLHSSSKLVDLHSDDESTDMRFSVCVDDSESKPNLEIANLAKNLLEKWKFLKLYSGPYPSLGKTKKSSGSDDFRIPRREKQDPNKIESDSHLMQSNMHKNSNNVTKNSDKHTDKSENVKEEKDNKDSFYFNEEPQEIKVVCNIEDKYSPYRKWGEYPHKSKLSKEDKRSLFAEQMERRSRWKKRNNERGKNISFSNSSPHFNGYTDFYSSPVNQTYDSYNVVCSNPTNHDVIEYTAGNHCNSIYVHTNAPRAPMYPNPGTQTNVITDRDPLTPNVFVPPLVQMPFMPLLPSVPSPSSNFQSNLPLPPPPLQQHVIGVQDNVQVMNSSPLVTGNTSSASDLLLCGTSFMNPINDQNSMHIVSAPHVEEPYPQVQESNETPEILPPNWKTATDEDGNVYYYHTKERRSQWEFPDVEEPVSADLDNGTPTYDEPEHKHATKSRRSHKKHSKRKSTTTAPADTSSNQVINSGSEIAKKIKELFRTKMSSFVVECLNPYRKENCRVGRISTNEDFKHLARKLTHFVMAKELKHCKNVEDLDCNDNVKHKARDYIHKYMARYGPLYRKEKSISFVDEKQSA